MTSDKKYEDKFSLELPFGEALQRFAQTDPHEVQDIQKERMSDDTIEGLIDAFEACAQTTEDGREFWLARDLMRLFEYGEWRFFKKPLEKAIEACKQSRNDPANHFVHVHEMVDIGSGATRQIDDLQMTRYACYLTAQNADAKKRPVAFAQTYFAIQTRRQEIADRKASATAIPMSEDEKRVYLRTQIKEHNRHLSSAAKAAGVVTPQEFSIFHSNGYQGLYGKTVGQIRRYKGIEKSTDILDRMGSTELAANFFRVTQTEEKLRKEDIKGKEKAYRTHYEVGRQVRDAMLKISGIAPEDLPAVDHIRNASKRLGSAPVSPALPTPPTPEAAPPAPRVRHPVNLSADLWKYALLVMVQRDPMEISTAELIAELPNYIDVPETASEANSSRRDSKFSQLVRNLKSHKTSSTNFIAQGYAEDIPNGFRATEKGFDFVIKFFKDRA
jgi:hypothetical protein